jgi:hypothetical protein
MSNHHCMKCHEGNQMIQRANNWGDIKKTIGKTEIANTLLHS